MVNKIMKTKIKLIILGHLRHSIDLQSLQKTKSNYFTIESLDRINNLPTPVNDTGYLNIVYSKDEIANILNDISFDGICIGIINYGFDDNFYMHRVGNNKMCISIEGIDKLLLENEISLENFILKCIYEAIVFYKVFGSLTDDRVYSFVHRDTRGCLFDLNGDKFDVLYNTEKPTICEECATLFNRYDLPIDFLKIIKKELLTIRKPRIKSIELFIRKYPLLSVLITFLSSTIINIFSNWLWEYFKK